MHHSVGCLMVRVLGFQNLILSALLVASSAHALKMDETTHDEIIGRLEIGIESMEKTEPERAGILLRLADLYADRARLKGMNEIEQNCQNCRGAKNDRKKAIALYTEALPRAEKAKQGRIVLQVAHLNALNQDQAKATGLYNQILAHKKAYSSEVRAIANASLGEIYFKQSEFKKAQGFYEAARRENLQNRALVEFRLAWCHLNLGRNDLAIKSLVKLLQNQELLQTATVDGKSIDTSFVQDVSHDLALFLARAEVGPRQIDMLKQLSPANSRKANLHTLASETDRLGKKTSSLIVWAAYVDEGEVQPNEKLEVQTRVAQIFYDMNNLTLAANAYEKSLDLWKKNGCSDEALCEDLKGRLRKFVTSWNKAQKKKPTMALFRVYNAYLQVFSNDAEMLHWAAVTGHDLKRYKEAASLFHRAAEQANVDLQKTPANAELKTILEGSLLGEIEMAEASKDNVAKENAYNYYLQANPGGSKAFEVRYQRAQLYYSTNRYQDAFSEFHYLASTPDKTHKDLRMKSADLALDSLVAMKDDKNLQTRSLEYARFFPERKSEYLKISRKATLNIVAGNLKNDSSAGQSDYSASLVALNQVNMEGADDQERIKFLKNKIVVAQKALDLNSVADSSMKLLSIKKLSQEDREWTMSQQVWVAELKLNFAEAYKLSKKMKLSNLSSADRELRLALLADLAGLNSKSHNEKYLNLAGSSRAANLVRISLIKDSSNPWKELNRHLPLLKKNPDLLAGITLETFARKKDFDRASRLLKTTQIGRYAAGQTLQRQLDLREFHKLDREIRDHRIYGYSDRALQKSLKERLKLIGQSDRRAQQAFLKGDWTLKILSLSQLARENRRVYQDIVALPVPAKLNAADKAKYRQLLTAKAQPYLQRSDKINSELADMWSASNSVQGLQAAYMTATPEMQRLYRDEINPLAQNAPEGAANRLRSLLTTPLMRPSQRDVMVARRELQANPFDISKAQRLRDLENQKGSNAMVVYLDERISQLKKGETL